MLVSGFTIIRNGVQFDFPFLESIASALPICDEFIVNVGVSSDSTFESIKSFHSNKIKIIESVWPLDDSTKRQGGQILAEQTNLALSHCKGKWCLYLQADELLHENEIAKLRRSLDELKDNPRVEACVFQYHHFYANYDVVQTSRSSYRREIRAIKNGLNIQSTGDAQSFRHSSGQKLNAVLLPTHVFHYGWVRPPEKMLEKTLFMDSLYHHELSDKPATGDNYRYKRIPGLQKFYGTHPTAIKERMNKTKPFDLESTPKIFHLRDLWKMVSGIIERFTGKRLFEYKNYKLIKP